MIFTHFPRQHAIVGDGILMCLMCYLAHSLREKFTNNNTTIVLYGHFDNLMMQVIIILKFHKNNIGPCLERIEVILFLAITIVCLSIELKACGCFRGQLGIIILYIRTCENR